MTRRSKREIERAVDDIDADDGPTSIVVAYRDPRTGGLVDRDGEPIDEEEEDGIVFALMSRSVVMYREDAEAKGREILEPVESEQNPDADLVKVPWDPT